MTGGLEISSAMPSAEKQFFVYILASGRNGTLYVGVTSNLAERVGQHVDKTFGGFTAKYNVDKLVYFEPHGDAESAIRREKQLKKWNRAWKIELIEAVNPTWGDLYSEVCE
jgi:putative endonuclease